MAVVIALTACSPKLNWRTVQSPEQRYTAQFPGKPDKIERQISFQDQELKQTLEAVKIDDAIYSISSIYLSANQSDLISKIVDQLQNNLLARAKASGGSVKQENVIYQITNRQRLPIQDYLIGFQSNGKIQQSMRVRWIARVGDNGGAWIYQISVLNTNPDAGDVKLLLSKKEYANFFSEFHPE